MCSEVPLNIKQSIYNAVVSLLNCLVQCEVIIPVINVVYCTLLGIHYIGEMRSNTVARLLVNQLTDGQLEWCDLIDEFDVVSFFNKSLIKLRQPRQGF